MNGVSEHDVRPTFRYNIRASTPQLRDSSMGMVTLLALRTTGTLLHRVPEPTDSQDAQATSVTKHHNGPHALDRPAHRHAPKSVGGRALGRPALPLQPGARHNGAPPAPPYPPHTLASSPLLMF